MDIFELKTCSKTFGDCMVLSAVSCTLKKGDVLAIFGRNGTGKSTLMNILFGTLKADSMDLKINGAEITTQTIRRERIFGLLPQHGFLPGELKVRDMIPFFLYKSEAQNKVFYAPGISEIASKRIRTLSIGQCRYLEFLLVGSMDHRFLLLDEPFIMIDPIYKDHVKEYIGRYARDKGILVTDHYYDDVWQVSNRHMVLEKGMLYDISSKKELQEHGYLACGDL